MSGDVFLWRKIKDKDIFAAEKLLRANEKEYVSACGRFLIRSSAPSNIWGLYGKLNGLSGLLINSRSTFIPVLCGNYDTPSLKFLKEYLKKKKLHSVQGREDEVIVIENEIKKIGGSVKDIFYYDLMNMEHLPDKNVFTCGPSNLVLKIPKLTDLDQLAPLQAAYEQEEVQPKGSVFSPAASRINISNIVAKGHILTAEINGRLVGKININAVSFSRYQIGGVYVHPNFRGLGIARRMAGEFTSSLIIQGKGLTLFVKKNNLAAKKLYTALGFTVAGDYRITYY